MSEDNYYTILGIDKTASSEQIKRAYYKQAQKYHPDKIPDANKKEEYTQKFQSISEAYATLSDENKRRIYDQLGKEGLKGQSSGGFNPFDMFSQVFSSFNFSGFSGFNNGMTTNVSGNGREGRKSPPVVQKINLTLKDLYLGKVGKLAVTRKAVFKLNSSDKVDLAQLKEAWLMCVTCQGNGQTIQHRQAGPFYQQITSICPKCQGSGYGLNSKYELKNHKEIIEYTIEAGMSPQTQFKYEGYGDCTPGMEPGDIIISFNLLPDPVFQLEGLDLHVKKEINLVDALVGFDFVLTHLDGRKLLLKSQHIITAEPTDTRKIKGEGLNKRGSLDRGDLIVHFNIQFPESLTVHQINTLKQLLPSKHPTVTEKLQPLILQ